jgi:hypothetical protein
MPHADISDPMGDTVADSRQPVPPDLVRANADATGGNISFVVQLAPGTLDRQTTRVAVLLDTDRNAATGISQGNGLGADYGVDLDASTGQASINKADPVSCAARMACFSPIGSVSITFTTDGMQFAVPLPMLGSSDGRMCFQLHSYVLLGILNPVTFDYMPNTSPACVQ